MTTTEKKRLRSPGQPVGRWIRVEKRLAINLRDHHTCLLCLRDLSDAAPADVTLDHIDPENDPATGRKNNSETNLYTCCRSCNSSRQDKPLTRFASPEALKHIRRNVKRSLKPYMSLARAYFADQVGQEETITK
jgi:5-methylcytosine-specific restriction endonuclease McrA